jgi:hypothetical protein
MPEGVVASLNSRSFLSQHLATWVTFVSCCGFRTASFEMSGIKVCVLEVWFLLQWGYDVSSNFQGECRKSDLKLAATLIHQCSSVSSCCISYEAVCTLVMKKRNERWVASCSCLNTWSVLACGEDDSAVISMSPCSLIVARDSNVCFSFRIT